jgi:outer membrane protein assembly factor BamA
VNGVVFLDAASAWNAGTDPRFFSSQGGLHTEGMHLAYGFGARINLGYFILRYDYGREHGIERGPGESHHFLTFGPEF